MVFCLSNSGKYRLSEIPRTSLPFLLHSVWSWWLVSFVTIFAGHHLMITVHPAALTCAASNGAATH